MKIRVMNSRTAVDMIEAMGGKPTPISFGELYSALSQGIVDGAENNPPSFTSSKHSEVCKHFSLDGHTRVPDILMISTKVWKDLDPHVQNWVSLAASDSATFQRKLWEEKTLESLEAARQADVTIYKVDTAAFAKKVAPMFEAIEDEETRNLANQIREVR